MTDKLDEVAKLLTIHAEAMKHPNLANIKNSAMDRLNQLNADMGKLPMNPPPAPELRAVEDDPKDVTEPQVIRRDLGSPPAPDDPSKEGSG